jgi:hypothetical protein
MLAFFSILLEKQSQMSAQSVFPSNLHISPAIGVDKKILMLSPYKRVHSIGEAL